MNDSYVDLQMDMHRVQELDELYNVLTEQKAKNEAALRRVRQEDEKGVYICGGAFFQKIDKESALSEIESRIQRFETNIRENREEYELLVKKLHQIGIYGI
ncbi:hypothetical protein AV274_3894 [Blastocystis sp. ATCC 50177/Nand II]|uniref:Prefoldin n=1 Tax=Blastocystis sp. subtype 1 (strain ATCC 50177 / NandII) TaxID=478820 RepID=A0A196SEJ0_BLAHN|nr:hypothetical protein AV274_3894 [Blastocystis sp. ATCC 50177/Nand II]